ncbi:MAG: PP2C family protein-serine/threonine phosphatase [Patescibacteria group bacterium]
MVEATIFAWGQRPGGRTQQEDHFGNFGDECFILADGVGGLPHGEIAAQLAVATAIWGYQHIRQRPFYWRDKKLFLARIFRSTNISLWQKQREEGFREGFATTLVVAIIGTRTFWLGSVGDTSAFLYRDSLIDKLTTEDVDSQGYLTKALGAARYGLKPQIVTEAYLPGDILLLATDGVAHFLEEEPLRQTLERTTDTVQSLQQAVEELLGQAQANGSTDNMTLGLIKRIKIGQEI